MFEVLERERDTDAASVQPMHTTDNVAQEEYQKLQSFLDPSSSSSSNKPLFSRPQQTESSYMHRKLEASISTDVPQEHYKNPYLKHNIPRQPVYQFM